MLAVAWRLEERGVLVWGRSGHDHRGVGFLLLFRDLIFLLPEAFFPVPHLPYN